MYASLLTRVYDLDLYVPFISGFDPSRATYDRMIPALWSFVPRIQTHYQLADAAIRPGGPCMRLS